MTIADLQASNLLEPLDVELARALGAMADVPNPDVELAIALTSRNVRRGHACLPLDTAESDLRSTGGELTTTLPEQESWAATLSGSPLVDGGPLVLDEKRRLYLRRYWELERDIASELARRASKGREDEPSLVEALNRLFGEDPESPQRRAARNALEHPVSVLCGGPGTGKTSTVAAIVALLVEDRLRCDAHAPKVMLLAPTGKAAVRLSEAVAQAKKTIAADGRVLACIPAEATTIHRALAMRRHGMRFARDADSPVDADVIVLDEASMVDLGMMRQLLVASPVDATIVIVGDPDQLTSVEAGSVLRDLVRASDETWWRNRVTQLTRTYRYDEAQPLGRLVAAIRDGDSALVEQLLGGSDADAGDVQWSSHDGLQDELDRASKQWSAIVTATGPEEHFRLRAKYAMLSPFRKGRIGTERLGVAIEQRIEALEPWARPIIVEENNNELGVYNGDFGLLFERDGTEIATIQREPDRLRDFAEARLPRYSSAYALSVHKAQGSEFDEVLIVMPEEDGPLLTRELLYTAVSRAKSRVRIVGPQDVIAAAIGRRARRLSGLVDQIAALAR